MKQLQHRDLVELRGLISTHLAVVIAVITAAMGALAYSGIMFRPARRARAFIIR